MGRTKGAKNLTRITDQDLQEMRRLRSMGVGLSDIGARWGISRWSVSSMLESKVPPPPRTTDPPAPERDNTAPAEGLSITPPADSDMPGDTEAMEVRLSLLEKDLEGRSKKEDEMLDELRSLRDQLREVTKKPIAFERHGDDITASCPNCSTTASMAVPKVTPKSDEVFEAFFKQPHEGGTNVAECKTCRPKLEHYLNDAGYRMVKK